MSAYNKKKSSIAKKIHGMPKPNRRNKSPRIIFFRIGALGDVLMTTPLVRAVRKKYPDAVIDYWLGRHFSKVLEGNRHINSIIQIDEGAMYSKNPFAALKIASEIRKKKYDIIFVLEKHIFMSMLAFLAGIKKRIGFRRTWLEGMLHTMKKDYKQDRHDITAYLELASLVGVDAKNESRKMELALSPGDDRFADDFFRKNSLDKSSTIAVIPGGAKNPGQELALKRMPEEKYARVIERLAKKNSIVLLGGPDDIAINTRVLNLVGLAQKTTRRAHTAAMLSSGTDLINADAKGSLGTDSSADKASAAKDAKSKGKKYAIIDLAGKTSIKQSAAIMKRCRLVICNDTGPMHLASCVNDNILSIFGPTDPRVLAPLNPGARYAWKEKHPLYSIFGKIKYPQTAAKIWEKVGPEEITRVAEEMIK